MPWQRAHQHVKRNDDVAHTMIVHKVVVDTHVVAVVVVVIVCVDANTIVTITVVRRRAL